MSAGKHTPGPLSEKQLVFLTRIASSEIPTEGWPEGLPLYASHRFMEFEFNTEGERRRWFQNLESRGLVTCKNGCFFRLTDAGRAAIAKATGGAA